MRLPITDPLDAIALYTILPLLHPAPPSGTLLPEIVHHIDTGARHLTFWFQAPHAAPASSLIQAHRHPRAAENLQITQPAHPFLAARYALETYARLLDWQQGRTGTPPAICRTHGPLLASAATAGPDYDLLHHAWKDGSLLTGAMRLACPLLTAALITVGFPIHPQRGAHAAETGLPTFIVPAQSLTFPGLTFADILTLLSSPLCTQPLPGYPIGEHPFHYAHAAVQNSLVLPQWITLANKSIKICQRGGTQNGGIFASASLLEESCPDSTFRDRVLNFL